MVFRLELRRGLLVSTQVHFPAAIRRFAFAILTLLLAVSAGAQTQATFTQKLLPADWKAAGLMRLSAQQTAALDALIQHDIQSARDGDVVAFSKSFTDRRTPEEITRSGINLLTASERAQLDRLVAGAVAAKPTTAFMASVPASPIGAEAIQELKPKPEVHGEVSMFVGSTSHRGSFYGGSFDAVVIDPSHRFSIGVGMSEVRGKGAPTCFDGPLW